MEMEFPITTISRAELLEVTGDKRVANLTDEDMETFASLLSEEYVGGQFLDDVAETWTQHLAEV